RTPTTQAATTWRPTETTPYEPTAAKRPGADADPRLRRDGVPDPALPDHGPRERQRHQAGTADVPQPDRDLPAGRSAWCQRAVRLAHPRPTGCMGRPALVGDGRHLPRGRRHDAVLVAPHLPYPAAVAPASRASLGKVHERPHDLPQQLLLLPAD